MQQLKNLGVRFRILSGAFSVACIFSACVGTEDITPLTLPIAPPTTSPTSPAPQVENTPDEAVNIIQAEATPSVLIQPSPMDQPSPANPLASTSSVTSSPIQPPTILSADATLSSLVVSSGALIPAFTAENIQYTTIASGITSVTLTATTRHPKARIRINKRNVTSGLASPPIPIKGGVNTITIKVIAEDGTRLSYSLNINPIHGIVTTLTEKSNTGDRENGPTASEYSWLTGMSVDPSGNLYFADYLKWRIRRIDSNNGGITTFAGTGSPGKENGIKNTASFRLPQGITMDSSGNIYTAEAGNILVRKITPNGEVTTLAEQPQLRAVDIKNHTALSGIAVDSSRNVYVADHGNHLIRKIHSNGIVTIFAGSGNRGRQDGIGNTASFSSPSGIAIDFNENIYVADYENHLIRKITQNGVVTTLAGSGDSGTADGTGTSASFASVQAIAINPSTGNLYVAERFDRLIRKITPDGVVTTVAGSSDSSGRADGTGTSATFLEPSGITVDSTGNIYVADYDAEHLRFNIRKIQEIKD